MEKQRVVHLNLLMSEVGTARRWWRTEVLRRLRRGILLEVENDLSIVEHWARRAAAGATTPEQIDAAAEALARLDAARMETDPVRAWRHINFADTLLPQLLTNPDLELCDTRLRVWDGSLDDKFKKKLEAARTDYKAARAKGGRDHQLAMQALQQCRSQIWNDLNNRIALKRALWASVARWVVFATAVAVVATALLRVSMAPNDKPIDFLAAAKPLAAAAALGFFGGALSALVNARKVVIDITSHRTVRTYTLLRMSMGAAGGFGLYLLLAAAPLGELSNSVATSPYAFAAVCIAGGFSERLFVEALEKAADNIKSVG